MNYAEQGGGNRPSGRIPVDYEYDGRQANILSFRVGDSATMDGATMDRSPLIDEQLDVELPNLNGDHAVGPTERTEKEYAPSTSERPAILSGYSTTFSAAHINRIEHLKHMWSWLASAVRGGRQFKALPRATPPTTAEPSSCASQPPPIRLGATRPLPRNNSSGGSSSSSSRSSNDGRKPRINHLSPVFSTVPISSGSTHGQQKKSRRLHHLVSAKEIPIRTRAELRENTEKWPIDDGGVVVDTMGVASGEEEKDVMVVTAASGIGLWASRGMLAVAAMLYGTEFGCLKLLQETVPMSLSTVLRFTVAVFPLLPFLFKTNTGVFRAGVEIGLVNAVGYWAQAKSLTTTTASKSAFICSLAVLLVPFVDAVFGSKIGEEDKATKEIEVADKKRQGVVFSTLQGPWFPALLAVAGVACLELIGAKSRPNTGDAWALMQPLSFGVGFWLTERSSRKYPEDTLGIVAAHLLTVAVLAIAWCAQAGQIPASFASLHETVLPSSGSLAVPLALLWTGLVTTLLPVFLETLAMAKVSAAESTVILSTDPIWATGFAAVLLGERIGWSTVLGAMLIVLACSWSSVGPSIKNKLLEPMATTETAVTSAVGSVVNAGDLIDTVGTDGHQHQQSIYLV